MTIAPNYDTKAPEHDHVTQGKHYKCNLFFDGVEITDNNGDALQIDYRELKNYWKVVEKP